MNKEKWARHYDDLVEQGFSEGEAAEMTDEAISDEEADRGDWAYECLKDRQLEERQ